jgi:uncharacterized protein
MSDDVELISSPLTQTISGNGHTLRIEIYRRGSDPWLLEIVDEDGISTVWDRPFESDQLALDAAHEAIAEAGGVHAFVVEAQAEALASELGPFGQARAPEPPAAPPRDNMTPLSAAELDALDRYLLDLDIEECMTLDMLDGFLHAIVIGPETVAPGQWLPKVWGIDASTLLPPAASLEEVNRVLGWVMRHYNGIVAVFQQHPPQPSPFWPIRLFQESEFEDADAWAYGFTEGVALSSAAWQPLLQDPAGQRWYRPIGLLGAEDFSSDQDTLTRTPQQRHALAADIAESLVRIHAFWLPLRRAIAKRHSAQPLNAKVGRNESCPCGSGKKFKKCCGAAGRLH